MIRFTIRLARLFIVRALALTDYIFSSNKNLTLETVLNKPLNGSKLLVYAIWSKDGLPSSSDEIFIESFRNQGFDVLVSLNADRKTRKKLKSTSSEIWNRLASALLIRKNSGRDMAAYRDAFRYLTKNNLDYSQIIFANNSVIWLPSKLENFVSTLNRQIGVSIFSATESFQPYQHAQTFLIGASESGQAQMRMALNKVRNTSLRSTSVIYGELKLNRDLRKNGLISVPMFSYSQVFTKALTSLWSEEVSNSSSELRIHRIKNIIRAEAHGQALNPTHFMWLELYELGFPGLKKDLVFKNPSRIFDVPLIAFFLEEQDKSAVLEQGLLRDLGYKRKIKGVKYCPAE